MINIIKLGIHIKVLIYFKPKIYNGIYSNAASSLASISRIFDISGKISKDVRFYTSGNAFGLNVFKSSNVVDKFGSIILVFTLSLRPFLRALPTNP